MAFPLRKREEEAKRNRHDHVEHDLPCSIPAPIHIVGKWIEIDRIWMVKNEWQGGYNWHQCEKQDKGQIDIHGGVHQQNVVSSCFPLSAEEKHIQREQGEKVNQYLNSHFTTNIMR